MGQNKIDKRIIVIIVLLVLLVISVIVGFAVRGGDGGGLFGGSGNYEKIANKIFENKTDLEEINTIFDAGRDDDLTIEAVFNEEFHDKFAKEVETYNKIYNEIKDYEFDEKKKGGSDLAYIQKKIKSRKDFYNDTLSIYNTIYDAYADFRKIERDALDKLIKDNSNVAEIATEFDWMSEKMLSTYTQVELNNCKNENGLQHRCRAIVDAFIEAENIYQNAKVASKVFTASKLYSSELIGADDDIGGRIGSLKEAMEKE